MNREPMTETMHEIAIYGAGGLGREICCLLRRINASVSVAATSSAPDAW